MEIFRLTPARYAEELSGLGAKLFGGRWNHKGIPCIYASDSRALCILEFSIHVPAKEFPGKLMIVTYEIPNIPIFQLNPEDLPSGWRNYPAAEKLKDMGSQLLSDGKYLMMKVPSAVVPMEFNFFLNPVHRDFEKFVKIKDLEEYEYDHRIKE